MTHLIMCLYSVIIAMEKFVKVLTTCCFFQLDPRIIQPFLAECRDTISKLDNQNMKAIKGLEDRLYALDQMIASCKKLVNEQKELAQVCQVNRKILKNHLYFPFLILFSVHNVPGRDLWPIRSVLKT